ncbi:MAG: AMP-binding protein, partial [Microthrixaceae bacterium]|nr:AMP-binding protein [Microthrixaceae bacterium]
MATQPLWIPDRERAAASAMARFRDAHGFTDYPELHSWSVAEPEAFWAALWDWTGMPADRGERVLEIGADLRDARFFPDARLNVAEVILDGGGVDDESWMYVGVDERSDNGGAVTRSEVRRTVIDLACAMRAAGVGPGDRVAAWMPNIPKTMMVMLAAASLGAVFSSTSPDFGVDGVVDRFGQIEPVLLFAADGYAYGGRSLDCIDRLATIREELPSVRQVVVVGHRDGYDADPIGDWRSIRDAIGWGRFLVTAPASAVAEFEFERFPFDHPWYVLFSSGTTGVPKCIVHRAGGVLLQHLKEHQLHCDIGPGDRVAYYTTAGWMMWNWLASVPASGA